MGWFQNITKVKKWGVVTKDFVVGVYEEITECTGNYTCSATASIKGWNNVESLADLDSGQFKSISKKALVTGSALISNQSFREKAFHSISKASVLIGC